MNLNPKLKAVGLRIFKSSNRVCLCYLICHNQVIYYFSQRSRKQMNSLLSYFFCSVFELRIEKKLENREKIDHKTFFLEKRLPFLLVCVCCVGLLFLVCRNNRS